MKKLLLILLGVLTMLPAAARDFTYNGLIYTVLSESERTVETKQGTPIPMNDKAGNQVSGDVIVPSTVYDESGNAYTVTRIGDMGFINRPEITSITLPSTLTSIGRYAMNNIGATEVVVPAGVTYIAVGAFLDCRQLKSAVLECKEVEIEYGILKNCPVLEKAEINGASVLTNEFFYNCPNLKEVTLPACMNTIEYDAFYKCTSLQSIKIAATTPPEIENGAFRNAREFTLYVPEGSKTAYANSNWNFYASSIQASGSTDNPGSPNVPGDFTYTYKGHTLTYTILDPVAHTCQTKAGDHTRGIPGNVASGNLYIPEKVEYQGVFYTVTILPQNAFYYSDTLTSVDIPNSITSIGRCAFMDCFSLTSIEIPNSVSIIEPCAFWECYSLTSVVIPNSVTSIDYNAFRDCRNLETVTCLMEIPVESIGSIFSESTYNNATLEIPEGCTAAYRVTSPWNKFQNIQEKNFSGVEQIEIADENAPVEVFDLNGVKVADSMEALPKGIYIVRQGANIKKVTR